jgi:hypothetical protein
MKHLILAVLVILGTASASFAAGGTSESPFYVKPWQGTTRTFKEVSCTTAGDVALVTAAEAASAISIWFQNIDGTNFATLCPVEAGTGTCNNANKGITLYAKGNIPVNKAVKNGPWSCKGDTGNVTVEVLIEK